MTPTVYTVPEEAITSAKEALSPEAEATKAEKLRLTTLLLSKQSTMVAEYRNTIKKTGGLLTTSMSYAYAKGLNDAFKLLTKEK